MKISMSTMGKKAIFLFCVWLSWTGVASPLYGSPDNAPNSAGKLKAARTVSGKVTGTDGSSLPGVNIIVKGTSTGTSTSVDGQYSINIENNNAVLVFSFIGYVSQEVVVGSREIVDVVLEESAEQLSEVVVTALGISREKRSLGYQVGEIKGKDVANVANESLLTSMAGRVSGVSINQTSGVGSSISVVIRGASSLGNNQPLFVVDGVPMANSLANVSDKGSGNRVDYGNAISDINPDDVESISVLKGPSAAALYGSRAGNGVILITTKSGKKGQGLGISFSTSNVWEKPYRYLDFHYKYANGVRPNQLDETSAYWGGLPLDAGNTGVQWNSNGQPTELRSYKDNMKNFLQTGFTTTNNIGVSGSTDKVVYRIGFNNMSNQGLIPNQDLYRNGISASTTIEMSKKVKLSSNLNFTRSKSNSRPNTSERDGNPLESVYLYPHVDVRDLKGVWEPGLEGIRQMTPVRGKDNPYFLATALQNGYVRDRIYGNIKLDWEILPGLTAFGRVSQDMFHENRETQIPWSYSKLAQGGYYLENLRRTESNIDFLVTYAKQVADFDLSVSGGGNYMYQNYASSSLGGNGLTFPGVYRISNVPISNRVADNWASEKAIYSIYGMASVGYKGQFYLDLTARNDWSSTLPAHNRSYFYPSASLSWLANESFRLPNYISLLKGRFGVAQVGNDTDPYRLIPMLENKTWGDLVGTGVPGTLLNPNLKPEIATSVEAGLDLNLFNNRLRFDLTYYDVANKNQILNISTPASSGFGSQLINAGLLVSRGWELGIGGTPVDNRNGWTLDVNANFSRNRVTLKELAPGMPFYEQWGEAGAGAYTRVGEQIGNMYSRGIESVTDPNSPYYRWPIVNAYKDQQGNWVGNGSWQRAGGGARDHNVKVGNYNPKFLFGMQTNLAYKRWNLGMSFDWRHGGEFMSFTYRYGESDWKSQRQLDLLISGSENREELAAMLRSDPDKYIIPRNGYFPRVGGHTSTTGGMGPDGDGTFIPGVWQERVWDEASKSYVFAKDENGNPIFHEWLGEDVILRPITNSYAWDFNQAATFDASFIKLREITLSYKFPTLFGRINNTTLSVYARNVMLWTKAGIGIDPERAFWADPQRGGFRQGIERQNVMPWTIPFGFKLNFDL